MSEGPRDRCHNCGKLIRYTVDARHRKYCDDACRQSAYRWRRSNTGGENLPKKIIERMQIWEEQGYSEPIRIRLMAIWQSYGIDALDEVETLLRYYKIWVDAEHVAQRGVYHIAKSNSA